MKNKIRKNTIKLEKIKIKLKKNNLKKQRKKNWKKFFLKKILILIIRMGVDSFFSAPTYIHWNKNKIEYKFYWDKENSENTIFLIFVFKY